MSDRMWAQIRFPVRVCQIGAIVDLIEQRLAEAEVEGDVFLGSDPETPWGKFDDLENKLIELGVAFDRRMEGKYEYDPQVRCFRPGKRGMDRAVQTDQGGDAVVYIRDLEEMARHGVVSIREIKRRFGPPRETIAEWAERHGGHLRRLAQRDRAPAGSRSGC